MAALDDKTVFVAAGGRCGMFYRRSQGRNLSGGLRDTADCRRLVQGCDWAVLIAANTGGAAYTVPLMK